MGKTQSTLSNFKFFLFTSLILSLCSAKAIATDLSSLRSLSVRTELELPSRPDTISASATYGCASYGIHVVCWNRAINQPSSLQLKVVEGLHGKVRSLSVDGSVACALDGEGLKCWNLGDEYARPGPTGNMPIQAFGLNKGSGCAINDKADEYHWQANEKQAHFRTNVKINPDLFVFKDRPQICYRKSSTTDCYPSDHPFAQYLLTKYTLKNALLVNLSDISKCIADENTLFCMNFENGFDHHFLQPNRLSGFNNPIQMATTKNYACLLDARSLRCWGDLHHEPSLSNEVTLDRPRSLLAEDGLTCVTDGKGAHCWGFEKTLGTQFPKELSKADFVFAGTSYPGLCFLVGLKVQCLTQ